ncbi:MAG: ISL3 family transposase [Streptosporangiaceae bacterium]
MRSSRVWAKMLGCDNAVVEGVDFDEQDAGDGSGPRLAVVVHVRPYQPQAHRCGICGRRRPGYDQGGGRRLWRALDAGPVTAWLEAAAPRVKYPAHGVVVAAVPWARHGAAHTRAFEDTVGWLACVTSKTTITQLMRVSWRAVGHIVERVSDEAGAGTDRLAGLRRIGIDEISYKRGHKYLTIIADHDSGLLVWAAPGRDKKTLRGFFDALDPDRAAALTHVSADGASWISSVVTEQAPAAVQCTDPFHVVSWATTALDEVRREVWNHARAQAGGHTVRRDGNRPRKISAGDAKDLKRARYALWKNEGDLTARQQARLAWIEKTHPYLYRAWLLKEGIRVIFQLKGQPKAAADALDKWLAWAARCRIPQFVRLGQTIRAHRKGIEAALEHRLSNGLIESVNTKIRVITRMAFGFHHPAALIGLAMLTLGGLRPQLPGR